MQEALRGFAFGWAMKIPRPAGPDSKGELLRRANGHVMRAGECSKFHGAFKGQSWPSAEDLPLRASPIVLPRVVTRFVESTHSAIIFENHYKPPLIGQNS